MGSLIQVMHPIFCKLMGFKTTLTPPLWVKGRGWRMDETTGALAWDKPQACETSLQCQSTQKSNVALMPRRAQPEPSLGQALRHEPGDFNYHQNKKERDFFYSWVSTAWGSQEFSLLMAVSYCSDIISYLARNTCHLKVHVVMCLYSTSGWLHPDPCSAWNCETLPMQSPGLNPDGLPASFFWQR